MQLTVTLKVSLAPPTDQHVFKLQIITVALVIFAMHAAKTENN